jgi:hypothetical protein
MMKIVISIMHGVLGVAAFLIIASQLNPIPPDTDAPIIRANS